MDAAPTDAETGEWPMEIDVKGNRELGSELKPNWGIVENFAPSWFAAVMGTGALALAANAYKSYLPLLAVVGRFGYYLNAALFIVLFVPWLLRWIIFPANAAADFRHPIMSNFFPTISAGLVVLAMDFIIIGGHVAFGTVLWLIGSAATIVFSVMTPFMMFAGNHIKLDHMNPGFFIPPVALLVVPLGGAILLPHVGAQMAQVVTLLNFFGFGTGFLLYLSLAAITLYRFILHDPLPNALAATVWINLGPLGASAVALINIAKYTPFISVKEPYFVAALILWAFGVWWLLMAVAMTLHYLGRLKFPYGLSWWGFTFPTGAFVLSSHAVAGALGMRLVDHIGFGVFWLLAGLWLVTLVKTVQHVIDGRLFAARMPAGAPKTVEAGPRTVTGQMTR